MVCIEYDGIELDATYKFSEFSSYTFCTSAVILLFPNWIGTIVDDAFLIFLLISYFTFMSKGEVLTSIVISRSEIDVIFAFSRLEITFSVFLSKTSITSPTAKLVLSTEDFTVILLPLKESIWYLELVL